MIPIQLVFEYHDSQNTLKSIYEIAIHGKLIPSMNYLTININHKLSRCHIQNWFQKRHKVKPAEIVDH